MLEQIYFGFIALKKYERLTKMSKAIPEEFSGFGKGRLLNEKDNASLYFYEPDWLLEERGSRGC